MMDPQLPGAGWYPDSQSGPGYLRYWDGASWTAHVATSVATPATITHAPTSRTSGTAIASLVLGIVGVFAALIPLFGVPVNVTGLILGLVSLKSTGRKLAIAGAILCSIGIVLTLLSAGWGIYTAATGQNALVNFLRSRSQ